MSFEAPIAPIDYRLCRYTGCAIKFRGPMVDVSRPFVAILGSSEVHGRFVHEPFPDLLARELSLPVANFGLHNAGLDVFLREEALLPTVAQAPLVIVQVMGAQNMSNRMYTVHARRNDRFLRHSRAMQRLFHGADFSDFVFTRHMLLELKKAGEGPFETLVAELESAWISRMERLLSRLPGRVVLVWIRSDGTSQLGPEPLFVTQRMIDAVNPHVTAMVDCDVSELLNETQLEEMAFEPTERPAARFALPPAAHEAVARCLSKAVQPVIEGMPFQTGQGGSGQSVA